MTFTLARRHALIAAVLLCSAAGETMLFWRIVVWCRGVFGLEHLQALRAGAIAVSVGFALGKFAYMGTAFGKTCTMADSLADEQRQAAGTAVAGSARDVAAGGARANYL